MLSTLNVSFSQNAELLARTLTNIPALRFRAQQATRQVPVDVVTVSHCPSQSQSRTVPCRCLSDLLLKRCSAAALKVKTFSSLNCSVACLSLLPSMFRLARASRCMGASQLRLVSSTPTKLYVGFHVSEARTFTMEDVKQFAILGRDS
jgi:hypothetical protein